MLVGELVASVPILHLPLPVKHVFGYFQPLAAPAQVSHSTCVVRYSCLFDLVFRQCMPQIQTDRNVFPFSSLCLCRNVCLSSVIKGATSHKAIDLSGNPVLRLYYTSRVRAEHTWLCSYLTVISIQLEIKSHTRIVA